MDEDAWTRHDLLWDHLCFLKAIFFSSNTRKEEKEESVSPSKEDDKEEIVSVSLLTVVKEKVEEESIASSSSFSTPFPMSPSQRRGRRRRVSSPSLPPRLPRRKRGRSDFFISKAQLLKIEKENIEEEACYKAY